jgi:hypothetical protein
VSGGGLHTLLAALISTELRIFGWGRGTEGKKAFILLLMVHSIFLCSGELGAPVQEEVRVPRVILVSPKINDKILT